MNLRSLCLVACLSAMCASTVSAQGEAFWPQWRGPARSGISPAKGLIKDWKASEPELVWMSDGLGSGYASVSISNGVIFTTGNVGDGQAVIAVSTENGKKLWSQTVTESVPRHGYDGSRSTPTLDGDMLYIVSSDGSIICLKQKDGSVVWKKNFRAEFKGKMMSGWGYSESPLVDGDWVLCTPGGKDAIIVALDKKTGEQVWATSASDLGSNGKDGAGYSSIVVSNAAGVKQYVQMVGRGLIGVRAKDGKLLWNYNPVANGVANIPTPLVKGDYVFGSTGYGTGAALLKLSATTTGVSAEEVYFLDAKTFQNHHGGMILIGDHIYAGHAHNQGFPICLEFATGKVVWGGKRGPGKGSAAIVAADGNLVFRYQDGTIALIEATTEGYNLKGTLKPAFQQGRSWAHPVVTAGRMYLREQDKLMCYDITDAAE